MASGERASSRGWLIPDARYVGLSRPRSFVVIALLGVALLCLVALDGPSRATWVIRVCAALWAALFWFESTVAPDALSTPRYAWLRTSWSIASVAVAAALCVTLAAPCSPLYALSLTAVGALATMGAHRSMGFVLALSLLLPIMRLATVGVHGARDALALACVSISFVVATRVAGRAVERNGERQAQLDAERALVRERSQRGLRTAMHLHDGLSGLLMVARTRAETSASYDRELSTAVALLLSQGERVLRRESPSLAQLEADLAALAASHGASVTLLVAGAPQRLSTEEWSDLAALLWEAGCNALREEGARVEITLSIDAGEARMDCRSTRREIQLSGGGGGRGLRFALLRASLRQGTAGLEVSEHRAHLWARWPRGVRRLSAPVEAIGPVSAAPVALALTLYSPRWIEASITWITLALAAIAAWFSRGERALDEATRALLDERNPAVSDAHLALLLAALEQPLRSLRRAHEQVDQRAACEALRALSRALPTLLRQLEEASPSATK